MKIQKIFSGISYITAYRVIAISAIIFMIGIIIQKIYLDLGSDTPTKTFVIFITTLGIFLTLSLLFVVNSFSQQEKQNNNSSKKGHH